MPVHRTQAVLAATLLLGLRLQRWWIRLIQFVLSRALWPLYSLSPRNLPSVGLCFSGFFFFSITIFSDGGEPTRSRASSFTAVTARNGFRFFLRGTARF